MAVIYAETPQWHDTLARVELFVNTERGERESVVVLLKRGRRTGRLVLDFDGLEYDDEDHGELVHRRINDLTDQLASALSNTHECSSHCRGRKRSNIHGPSPAQPPTAISTPSTPATTPGFLNRLTTDQGKLGTSSDTTSSWATVIDSATFAFGSTQPPNSLLPPHLWQPPPCSK